VGEYAGKIRQPTLLMIGERDDITSVADQHAVQGRFAKATLEQIDGVGHLIHYEAPLLAARFIQDFVEDAK
jgi:pimeloyl-ACP methyl ester carboxylesterase